MPVLPSAPYENLRMLKKLQNSNVLLIGLCILLMASNGFPQVVTPQEKKEIVTKKDNLKMLVIESKTSKERIDKKAYEDYVNGVIAEQVNDYLGASQFFNSALLKYPESYEIRFSLAEVYYRMQKFQDVLQILEPINPENVDVYSLRGVCYRSLGKNEEAKKSYLQVLESDSLNQPALTFLSSEYRRLNQLDSLVWTYEQLVKLAADNYRLWGELGQLQNQQGKSDLARKSFQESLKLSRNRDNLLSFIGLAESFRRLNLPDSASIIYQEAVKLDPNNSYLNRELASYYSEMDSLVIALQYAEKLTRLEPNNVSAMRYLALMYIRADSVFQAEEILKQLVNAGDNEPGNFFYLGRIAIMKQDYESAREYLTVLTQLSETSVDGWLDLGFVYRMQHDSTKSLNVYNSGLQFVKYKEDSVKLMFAIGSTLERNNKVSEASETFEKLLKLDPAHSQSLNYLGYMLADRGERLEYAHELIKKALDLSPENAAFIDSYGWVMYRLGKYDSAITYLGKAAEKESDPTIFDHLGDAYKALGKLDDARGWWQKALELQPTNDTIREKLNE